MFYIKDFDLNSFVSIQENEDIKWWWNDKSEATSYNTVKAATKDVAFYGIKDCVIVDDLGGIAE